jgi:hypothetical protein
VQHNALASSEQKAKTMTKSEAKSIEQRAGKALRILYGTGEPGAIDWGAVRRGGEDAATIVSSAIKAATDEVSMILEMACAELGRK